MKVEFKTIEGYEWMPPPVPATRCIPDWYRKMPQRPEETEPDGFPIGTAKLCSSFSDAMGAGYMIRLPFQCFVRAEEGNNVAITWLAPPGQTWQLVDRHGDAQLPGVEFDSEHPSIFKWQTPFGAKVPDGYTAFYTHPCNRPDLPFHTFSGMVDSDYDSAMNFPFIWVGGQQERILDAGTPIAQLIPIKLEEWEHTIETASEDELRKASRIATSHITGYRRLFRRGKTWQ